MSPSHPATHLLTSPRRQSNLLSLILRPPSTPPRPASSPPRPQTSPSPFNPATPAPRPPTLAPSRVIHPARLAMGASRMASPLPCPRVAAVVIPALLSRPMAVVPDSRQILCRRRLLPPGQRLWLSVVGIPALAPVPMSTRTALGQGQAGLGRRQVMSQDMGALLPSPNPLHIDRAPGRE